MMKKLLVPLFVLIMVAPCLGMADERDYKIVNPNSYLSQVTVQSSFKDPLEAVTWMHKHSERLGNRVPDFEQRLNLLRLVHYEATRANLDADLVLSVIEVESNFNKYAVSTAGAVGLMQIMPFWRRLIGGPKDSFFDEHTNLRYGCTILSYYLRVEKNNLVRALSRYNGSLGSNHYANLVAEKYQRISTRE
jgi:soluble lytic murein transglycosylase-like protein